MQVAVQEPKQEKKPKQTFTIVAFRYDEQHSVLYKTLNTVAELQSALYIAIVSRNADVISVRRVYECQPQTSQPTQ